MLIFEGDVALSFEVFDISRHLCSGGVLAFASFAVATSLADIWVGGGFRR